MKKTKIQENKGKDFKQIWLELDDKAKAKAKEYAETVLKLSVTQARFYAEENFTKFY